MSRAAEPGDAREFDSSPSVEWLDIGAGEHPHPEATHTLDIREDIPVDFGGVDISADEWPLPSASVEHATMHHILEHVPPESVGHVWRELDRVLVPGGTAEVVLPHAGTHAAATDLTHQGTGGTTPDVDRYFDADEAGGLEHYWPDLDWSVSAHARVIYPTVVRPSLRRCRIVEDGAASMDWARLPFTDVMVEIEIEKRGGQ